LSKRQTTILAAGCDGRLTSDWRKKNGIQQRGEDLLRSVKDQREKEAKRGAGRTLPVALEVADLPDIPATWAWAVLDQIVQEGRPIIYGIIKPGAHDPKGVPYVRVVEMKGGVVAPLSMLKRAAPERAAKFGRATLKAGDLLISKDGTIGRVAIVPPELEGGSITQHLVRASIHPFLCREYIACAIRSQRSQNWLGGETKGVALQGVNVEDFRRLPLPIPPLAEQEEIVRRVENLFALADRLEARCGKAKTQIVRLSQSILAKAFRGELVATEATRGTIQELIEINDPLQFLNGTSELKLQSLQVTTLQQLCGELLQRKVSEAEFLDRDALESKQIQVLYVAEALQRAFVEDYPTHRKFLSSGFDEFLSTAEHWAIAEMLQHEIGIVIKGRAEEQIENYRKLPRLKYGLPVETPADRGFVWMIFRRYQAQLQTAAQFDTDDIVLTTIGQLATPIWRRRRGKEGFDSIYIDETHLFNINELSLFHHLSKKTEFFPIAYSADRSQAVGDRGWTNALFEETLSPNEEARKASVRTEVRSIFRCSPNIVNLAFSVTSAGATLFTNFEDPLRMAMSMFTPEEERKCSPPILVACVSEDDMVAQAFSRGERMAREMEVSRYDVVLVAFSDELFRKAETYANAQNKPVELLKRRGDIEAVRRAEQSGRFVLSTPEFIGGLEFEGAILMGVDEGRVPPGKTADTIDSLNYLSYASHNRLYVAITRARYRVEVLIVGERGPSSLLKSAIASGYLSGIDSTARAEQ
jgi:hypothetical protein